MAQAAWADPLVSWNSRWVSWDGEIEFPPRGKTVFVRSARVSAQVMTRPNVCFVTSRNQAVMAITGNKAVFVRDE